VSVLEGRVALVTGAGGGVGRGIVLALAAAGAHVMITARRAATGDETSELVRRRGGSAIAVEADVTRRGELERAVTVAVERFGGLDVMVHNAVSAEAREPIRLEDLTQKRWAAVAAVSLRASYDCAQLAFPHLRARAGRLILLTSTAGAGGSAFLPDYASVKAAQRGLAKSLAREWGPLGITVNCIAPLARTPALEGYFERNPVAEERIVARTPMRRLGDSERDVGAAAVFLASDAASFVTGQTLVVDGGSFLGF
jgi:NAD(P)-dependent dehydrogenase (short-subunit alcohol dehydrogenase family)